MRSHVIVKTIRLFWAFEKYEEEVKEKERDVFEILDVLVYKIVDVQKLEI